MLAPTGTNWSGHATVLTGRCHQPHFVQSLTQHLGCDYAASRSFSTSRSGCRLGHPDHEVLLLHTSASYVAPERAGKVNWPLKSSRLHRSATAAARICGFRATRFFLLPHPLIDTVVVRDTHDNGSISGFPVDLERVHPPTVHRYFRTMTAHGNESCYPPPREPVSLPWFLVVITLQVLHNITFGLSHQPFDGLRHLTVVTAQRSKNHGVALVSCSEMMAESSAPRE